MKETNATGTSTSTSEVGTKRTCRHWEKKQALEEMEVAIAQPWCHQSVLPWRQITTERDQKEKLPACWLRLGVAWNPRAWGKKGCMTNLVWVMATSVSPAFLGVQTLHLVIYDTKNGNLDRCCLITGEPRLGTWGSLLSHMRWLDS